MLSLRSAAFAALLWAIAPLYAQQSTGSISGSVRDASGQPLAAAQIQLSNTATGVERKTQTNESGDFVLT